MNIKRYLGLDSLNTDSTGRKWKHREIYGAIVKAVGIKTCTDYIPATREQIIKALQTDKNLNNIPLAYWDTQFPYFRIQLARIGITVTSISDTVCVLKEAARLWAEGEEI